MEVAQARAELGLGAAPTWTEVRVAYRAQIAACHPDRPGGDAARAAVVTEAYAILERAQQEGRLADTPVPPRPPAGLGDRRADEARSGRELGAQGICCHGSDATAGSARWSPSLVVQPTASGPEVI